MAVLIGLAVGGCFVFFWIFPFNVLDIPLSALTLGDILLILGSVACVAVTTVIALAIDATFNEKPR